MRPRLRTASVLFTASLLAGSSAGALADSSAGSLAVAAEPTTDAEVPRPDDEVPRADAGRLPPRQVEVREVDDAPDGIVAFDQQVLRFVADPGQDAQPELTLTSGVDGEVELALEVVAVGADEDGRAVPADEVVGPDGPDPDGEEERGGAEAEGPAEGEGPAEEEDAPEEAAEEAPPGSAGRAPLASAVGWVTLPTDSVVLAGGERAHLWPTITVPAGAQAGSHLAALRATTGDESVVAFLIVDVGSDGETGRPRVEISMRQDRDRVHVTLHQEIEGTVSGVGGELRLVAWGLWTVARIELPQMLVLPGVARTDELVLTTPLLPGRYVAEIVLGEDGHVASASTSAWLWDRRAAIAVSVVLLLASCYLLYRARTWR